MDDLRAPVLGNYSSNGFKPLKTIYLVCFLITLMVLMEFITLAYLFTRSDHVRCDLFYLLVYAEVTLWIVNFIIRFYIKWKHKLGLIANNYFNVHQDCIRFIEVPFYISCIWLGILVVLLCVYAEYDVPHEFYCDTSYFYSPIIAVSIAISVQNALIIPLFIQYIVKIFRFNENPGTPDQDNTSFWTSNPLQSSLNSPAVGYRERCEVLDERLEKQADLIRHYKEANEVLREKIFQLTAQGHTASEF
ncbi:hypothetical protein V9T40_005287 [Parthenolecanium corni]|uniref:Transmembrane protein 192 n=1 Tax=Parthenolecanium corni TaxID=536013 RepID=A0AAN9THL9_9HEMI